MYGRRRLSRKNGISVLFKYLSILDKKYKNIAGKSIVDYRNVKKKFDLKDSLLGSLWFKGRAKNASFNLKRIQQLTSRTT